MNSGLYGEGVKSHETGIRAGCRLPDIGTENRIWVLLKSNIYHYAIFPTHLFFRQGLSLP